jgi:hypothetical protein
MFEKGGEEHLKAMGKMSEIMQNPEAIQNWLDGKRKEFDSLPED